MITYKTNRQHHARTTITMTALALASALLLAGCFDIKVRAGKKIHPNQLQSLTIGQSTANDVRMKLGVPYGRGRSYLPLQQKQVVMWNYYYELGTLSDARRTFLFVYLDNGIYDGHMWFSSLPETLE